MITSENGPFRTREGGMKVCKWGTDELCLVPIPAELSHTGEFRWAVRGVDACIADLVAALNAAGIYTAQSCCGHGKGNGRIDLHDGRILLICSEDSLPEEKR